MGGSRGENEHEKRGADAREAVGGVDVSLLRVAVGATVGATIIGRGVRSSIKTLWLTNSHMSSTRISSPAGGVEGAAASSFIDRLRDGWRPCP